MKILIFIIISFLIFISFEACNTQKRSKLSEKELDSLRVVYKDLNDSMKVAWDTMITFEDERLQHLKNGLEWISIASDGKIKIDSLIQQVDTLKTIRYQYPNFTTKQIDRYDATMQNIWDMLQEKIQEEEELKEQNYFKGYANTIQENFFKSIIYRNHYDQFAEHYNQFIILYKSHLHIIDTTNKKPTNRTLFRLEPTI